MRHKRKPFFLIPVFVIAIISALSVIVMLLWNGVLSEILPVKKISFLQAAGLFILCKILFSSFRPGGRGGFRRDGGAWREKLMNMSPEERDQFKNEWRKRF